MHCKQMLDLKTSKTQTSQGFHRAATLQLSCLVTCVVPIMAEMSMTEPGSCASMLQRQRTLNQTALPEVQIDDRIRCLGCGEKKTLNAIPAICFWGVGWQGFLTKKQCRTEEFPLFRIFLLRLPSCLAASRHLGPCETSRAEWDPTKSSRNPHVDNAKFLGMVLVCWSHLGAWFLKGGRVDIASSDVMLGSFSWNALICTVCPQKQRTMLLRGSVRLFCCLLWFGWYPGVASCQTYVAYYSIP